MGWDLDHGRGGQLGVGSTDPVDAGASADEMSPVPSKRNVSTCIHELQAA